MSTSHSAADEVAEVKQEQPWHIDVPEKMSIEVADIYCVGFGLRLPNDITLETLAILKACKRVFGMPPITSNALPIPEIEDLTLLYGPEKPRIETYREMVNTVLAAAHEDPPVAMVTYGSAIVGALPTHLLVDEAPLQGLRVYVSNSASCFEGIWSDLNIEPFFGFSVWEASMFLSLNIEPQLQSHLLLVQASFVNVTTGPDRATGMALGDIERLQERLLEFYPPEHVVSFVRTASFNQPTEVRSASLGALTNVALPDASSLLVPRLVAGSAMWSPPDS